MKYSFIISGRHWGTALHGDVKKRTFKNLLLVIPRILQYTVISFSPSKEAGLLLVITTQLRFTHFDLESNLLAIQLTQLFHTGIWTFYLLGE